MGAVRAQGANRSADGLVVHVGAGIERQPVRSLFQALIQDPNLRNIKGTKLVWRLFQTLIHDLARVTVNRHMKPVMRFALDDEICVKMGGIPGEGA